MTPAVRFHFDPLCPWCWMTSKWVRQLERLGVVRADWAVFSLAIVNAGTEKAEVKGHARGSDALRTVIAVRQAAGRDAVGRFYAELGGRIHERGEDPAAEVTITGALTAAGLDPGLLGKALADDATWAAVEAEHTALVERTRSFGVPTIVLDGGEGPAIFGPVISEVPSDEDAVELWHHVEWLTRYGPFSELKRDRTELPDLESVRQFVARKPDVDLT